MVSQENPAPFVLSPELNERAARLVLTAVALYPQSSGSMTIVADRLMGEFEPSSRSTTGVTISHLANFTVDTEPATAEINRIHRIFGIDYMVSPNETLGIMTGIAFGALEYIRKCALQMRKPGVLPRDLTRRKIIIPSAPRDPFGPARCRTQDAMKLQEVLASNASLRHATATAVRLAAAATYGARAQQRQRALRMHHDRQAFRAMHDA